MKKIISTLFSIILILFFHTSTIFGFSSILCVDDKTNFDVYISMVKSSFNKKFNIILKGDEIPNKQCQKLYLELCKYIKSLEQKNFKSKLDIIITYSAIFNSFKFSYIERNIFIISPKYV